MTTTTTAAATAAGTAAMFQGRLKGTWREKEIKELAGDLSLAYKIKALLWDLAGAGTPKWQPRKRLRLEYDHDGRWEWDSDGDGDEAQGW